MQEITNSFSDLEIIDQVLNGKKSMYEILIRRYNSLLYKIGRSYSFNHEDTQDLMQETYINVFRNMAKFENRSTFKTWVTRIMLNQCYHKLHAPNKRIETISETMSSTIYDTMFTKNVKSDSKLLNDELNYVLENAISEIPENYRLVFSLRELNGLNVSETAAALDISENNVKVRLNRAKALLREKINKTYSPQDIFEFNLIYCDSMVKRVMTELKND